MPRHFTLKLIVSLLPLFTALAQNVPMRFHTLNMTDGLAHNSVTDIWQDQQGFLWIATMEGLNRYDGYEFRHFRRKTNDARSLSYNRVLCLFADRDGAMWVGTGNGLNRYNPLTEDFDRFLNRTDDHQSSGIHAIWNVAQDTTGMLWLASEGGVLRLNPETGKHTQFTHDPDNPRSLIYPFVNTLLTDNRGTLWVGTEQGLDIWEPATETFAHVPVDPSLQNHITALTQATDSTLWVGTRNGVFTLNTKNFETKPFNPIPGNVDLDEQWITQVYADPDGEFWMATEKAGILLISRHGSFQHFSRGSGDKSGLSDNRVQHVFRDNAGALWVGTWTSGLNMAPPLNKPFELYRYIPGRPNGLNANRIYSLAESSDGRLWIGTAEGGLNEFNPRTGRFTHHTHDPANTGTISSNYVWNLAPDGKGMLWMGTDKGLNRLNTQTGRFTYFQYKGPLQEQTQVENVYMVFIDRQDRLWAGYSGKGLVRFNPETKTFTTYSHTPGNFRSLSHNTVWCMTEDLQGRLWVGTMNGLNRFDEESGEFVSYYHQASDTASLSDSDIQCMTVSSDGTLWIGTAGGLNRYHAETDRFTAVTEADGLPNSWIYGILEESSRDGMAPEALWLSSNQGLCRYEIATGSIRTYNIEDGLQSNEFNMAALKTSDGRMVFGGINGLNIFHPDSVTINSFIPPVVLTRFQAHNQPVEIGESTGKKFTLRQSITCTRQLDIPPHVRFFSFEFAGLNFITPENNRYQYKLHGYDENWNNLGTRRFISFSNLPPDRYTLQIRASNNDGVWNKEGISLILHVIPPFHRTWWFRSGSLLTLALMVVTGVQLRIRRIRRVNSQLQAMNLTLKQEVSQRQKAEQSLREAHDKLEHRVAERTAELQSSLKEKTVLLKEVHHRVKNNLTVITSLLSLQARQAEGSETARHLTESQRRIRSMALVHESLYHTDNFSEIDFADYISKTARHLFQLYNIHENRIRLQIEAESVFLPVDIAVPCGLIINELISNSLKHAFPPGACTDCRIEIRLQPSPQGRITLTVSDNGVGMTPPDNWDEVQSLGMKLIYILATDQLDGTLHVTGDSGTSVAIQWTRKQTI